VIDDSGAKFRMKGLASEVEMVQFVRDWKRGQAEPHIKSQQEAPSHPSRHLHEEPMLPGVRRVTARNFQQLVIDSDADVFFQEFADWCPYVPSSVCSRRKRLLVNYNIYALVSRSR
jgi:hypothetical protein